MMMMMMMMIKMMMTMMMIVASATVPCFVQGWVVLSDGLLIFGEPRDVTVFLARGLSAEMQGPSEETEV
jgi:hypothetical protein